VAAASYEARAYGLHSGMPLATASRLCPQAIFIEGSFPKYHRASQRFMAILADFSPYIEPMGLDEAYLDVTGFESLYGLIHQMARALKARIKDELGLTASIGIAGGKVTAKVASDLSKPDGLLEVAVGGERVFLAPLPVGKLPGVGKKTGAVLRSLGIATIGGLADAPLDALKARFGVYGEMLHRHASGIDESEIMPPAEAKSISRETTFAEDMRDLPRLEATLRYLSERVGRRLRERGKEARCVTLKLRYADFTTITRRDTMSGSTAADEVIFSRGLALLSRALAQEKQLVRLIGIGVSGLTEPARQLSLLDTSGRRFDELDKAIDRIRKKYGFSAIQTGRTLRLKDIFPKGEDGYTLPTPGLSR
jgi:DNA polymerase-4